MPVTYPDGKTRTLQLNAHEHDSEANFGVGLQERSSHVPLIAHIIYKLDVGGMENGIVNLVNEISEERYLHVIICLTNYTEFRLRIRSRNIRVIAVHKQEGKDFSVYVKLWRLLRRLKPDIVYTHNLASLECQLLAWLAGVRCRVHGEHGWDVHDLHGKSRKRLLLRKLYRPLVHLYVPLSQHLENYLVRRVRVPKRKVIQIYNGVDTDRFRPSNKPREAILPVGFAPCGAFIIGTVGRLSAVKDQVTLLRAFLLLMDQIPDARRKLRLILIGDGPEREQIAGLAKTEKAGEFLWMTGMRTDVPELLNTFDLFALPSLAEGISNTILEAMATGLPIVATNVGGNSELVANGDTGLLVPPADARKLAEAIEEYIRNPNLLRTHGRQGRIRAREHFSLKTMVNAHLTLYEAVLANKGRLIARSP